MNIYEKLQKIKVELLECNLKKSGNNKFSGFKYYELSDFMPHIIRLCDKYKVCTVIRFNKEFAELLAFDSEILGDQTPISVTSPIEKLEIKGTNAIQAIGGTQTYIRRYLYMAMFDITENDVFDATQIKKKPGISPDEKDELRTLIGDKNLENKILKQYKVNYLLELSSEQAKEIRERISKFKENQEAKNA
ncbi:MAG: ERF family protein [Oscillospiraceae bacterium]|jgi:hypothetical protein|nr:ERF family protein [Oscillospiraceae bacterium]